MSRVPPSSPVPEPARMMVSLLTDSVAVEDEAGAVRGTLTLQVEVSALGAGPGVVQLVEAFGADGLLEVAATRLLAEAREIQRRRAGEGAEALPR